MDTEKIKQDVEEIEERVSRAKSMMHVASYVLVGADSIEGSDLLSIKNIVDLVSEFLNGIDERAKEISSLLKDDEDN